jgi:uncharacterized protein YbbK (DUF523 family)
VFSIIPIAGTITRKNPKYRAVAICPTVIHGFSTCSAPICISSTKSATKIQNAHRISGRNCAPRTRDVSRIGIASRISSDANIAITPSSLLGIDRRIA